MQTVLNLRNSLIKAEKCATFFCNIVLLWRIEESRFTFRKQIELDKSTEKENLYL